MGIVVFDLQAVMPGAGSDQNIMGRYDFARTTADIRQPECLFPNLVCYGHIGDALFVSAKQSPVGIAAHSSPQLQSNHRAPGCFAGSEQLLDSGAHRWIPATKLFNEKGHFV